jgi:1-acyl-sn-glycerol-3-phosphate acyltransferase
VTPGRAGARARAARALLRLLLGRLFRLRLAGAPPPHGPYLLIANHQGWADAFVLIALLPAEPRVHFFADRAAVRSHWWKRLAIALLGGLVLVDRTKPSDRGAMRDALRVLDGGAVLALFPEGRVSRREADLGPFERGTGWLAARARVPVVPAWLSGTAELYLGREITVTLGAVRSPPEGATTRAGVEAITSQLEADVAALATPWIEPAGAAKRWRWLTDIL